MPWEVKKKGSKWCVFKKGSSSPIKGGCHSSKDDAVKHQKALYSNVEGAVVAGSAVAMEPYLGDDGLWRIDHVPMISTGIEYPLAEPGPTTFTEEELADAVAATEDPAIVSPRIKLGHTSGYNEILIGDAEQAFGRWENLELGDNGQTIYGDMVGTPEWLAGVLPIAYPNRSVEANFDAETVTGKSYKLVINACVLLGVRWPGCSVLEDLPQWYGATVPEGVEIDGKAAHAAGGDMAKAAVDVSQIRTKFYNEATGGTLLEGQDTYWWWVRGEKYDGNDLFLIADDSKNGDLYKIAVTVKDNVVSFGDPQQVVEDFPEKTAAARAAVVAGMRILDPEIVMHASRVDTGGPDPAIQKGASKMDDAKRKKLAVSAGLPEDATEEQIRTRLRQIRAEADDAGAGEELGEDPVEDRKPNEQRTGEGEGGEPTTPPGTPPGPAPSGTSPSGIEPEAEAGVVRVDRATWDQTQKDAALARQHENERVTARQREKVAAAVQAGKIPPARRDHYIKLMAMDEDGTTATLDTLEAGALPVGKEHGNLGSGDGEGPDVMGGQGLPDEWFPDLAAKRIAASTTTPVVVQAKEG